MKQQQQQGSSSHSVVVGVDTHRDFHVAAVIDSPGAMLGSDTFPATQSGYADLVAWARSFGDVDRAGVECTGSYGSAISRHLIGNNIPVIEANRTDRARRRRRGKSDTIDAEAAARGAVLGGYSQAQAKSADGSSRSSASSSWRRNPPSGRAPKPSTN